MLPAHGVQEKVKDETNIPSKWTYSYMVSLASPASIKQSQYWEVIK